VKRLLDTNDTYDEILFLPEREIILEDGEYKLGIPKQVVPEELSQDKEDGEQPPL